METSGQLQDSCIKYVTKRGLKSNSIHAPNWWLGPATAAAPRILLEMQILDPHTRPVGSETPSVGLKKRVHSHSGFDLTKVWEALH